MLRSILNCVIILTSRFEARSGFVGNPSKNVEAKERKIRKILQSSLALESQVIPRIVSVSMIRSENP